jgi:hypothetical protein
MGQYIGCSQTSRKPMIPLGGKYCPIWDIHNLANSLKLRKACGLDGIPNEYHRHVPRIPLVHLKQLCNYYLRLSHFPKPWKEEKL